MGQTAPYATKQDLLDRDESYLWNVAINRETDTLDDTAIQLALEDATEEINSFLKRYTLPLQSVPRILNRLAVSIAFYHLADRDNQATELLEKRYQQAISDLKDIAAGRRDLGLPPADKPSESSSGKAEVIAAYRPAMRHNLGGVL